MAIIELIAIFVLTRRLKKVLEAKGQPILWYREMLYGLWFAFELLGLFITFKLEMLIFEGEPGAYIFLCFAGGGVGAALGACIAFRIVRGLPDLSGPPSGPGNELGLTKAVQK